MSRRYLLALGALTLAMVLATLAVKWLAPASFLSVMPRLAIYFALVAAGQHWAVVRSLRGPARRFTQVFLATVVGTLLIHIAVLAIYLFNHLQTARPFLVAFCIGYVATLVFETVALVQLVKHERQKAQQDDPA